MLTCDVLVALRTDNEFDKFWDSVNQKAQEVGINELVLSQKCRTPVRFEDGHGDRIIHCLPLISTDLYTLKP